MRENWGIKYEMKYGMENESTDSVTDSHNADNECEEDISLPESLMCENFRSQGMKEREKEQDGERKRVLRLRGVRLILKWIEEDMGGWETRGGV